MEFSASRCPFSTLATRRSALAGVGNGAFVVAHAADADVSGVVAWRRVSVRRVGKSEVRVRLPPPMEGSWFCGGLVLPFGDRRGNRVEPPTAPDDRAPFCSPAPKGLPKSGLHKLCISVYFAI